MLNIDKISNTVIRLDDGITPVETHAVYRARVEKGVLILAPLAGAGKTFAAHFRIVRVNGQTFDTPDSLLGALSFIGNFNPGGGTSGSTLPPFEAGKSYTENQAIIHDNAIYTAKADFTAAAAFDPDDWNKVSVSDTELDTLIGDLDDITNSTEKTTVVAALNSLFKMIEASFGISIEIKSGGLYISRDSGIGVLTEDRLAELTDLEPLEEEIQGLHGKTARLNGYDFGMGITSENINDTDIQTMLTAYALVQLGLSDVADIPNFIGVHNLYNGDGGNHLLIFNQAITGSGTPDDPQFPAHWIDNGLDSVSVASSSSLGVVKGSNTNLEIAVATNGVMSVNGLSTALNKKFATTPDYSNMETINRIEGLNMAWIADRTGFVKMDAEASNPTSTVNFLINWRILSIFTGRYCTIFPVTKGDEVIISSAAGSMARMYCYFIPPRFVEID